MSAPMKLSKLFRLALKRCDATKFYSTHLLSDGNLLELQERGVFQNIYPENSYSELLTKLSTSQCIYCGFDPTADSLHVGNLLAILGLLHCQRYGHKAIALVGGATARLGDPSGKSREREPIDLSDVKRNVEKITENLQRIFHNHKSYIWPKSSKSLQDIRIVNNIDWYEDKNVVDFLSNEGRKFRMGPMLAKQSVQSRLCKKEGMNFAEFTYQIFQSYDWYHLYLKHNCEVQIGGTDQLGNISAGCDFIEKQINNRVFGLTIPLITTTAGNKLGKTAGNAVWLDPLKTSPYEFYQYFLNVSDSIVEKYLKLFTLLPEEEIRILMVEHHKTPETRPAQKKLAEQVTLLVHGEQGIQSAIRWTDVLFNGSVASLSQLNNSEIKLAPKFLVTELPIHEKSSIKDLCMRVERFSSEDDAERILSNGGVYVNYNRVNESEELEEGKHILSNNVTLLRIGKKNYHLVKWT